MSTSNKFTIEHKGTKRVLRVAGDLPAGFHGEKTDGDHFCRLDTQHAEAVRREPPWAAPQLVGMRKSFGFGDRLGIATPGHLAAARKSDMFPVLAQQSIREMARAAESARPRALQGLIHEPVHRIQYLIISCIRRSANALGTF